MATTKASERIEGEAGRSEMDPEIWSKLQNYIGLETIYGKLPFREFFQLRLVCKNWNRLAGDREFLEANFGGYVIPKPYFVFSAEGLDGQVRGVLSYDRYARTWRWTRIPEGTYEFWAMEGLCYGYAVGDSQIRRVFNLHTRVWITLPPTAEETFNWHPFAGMIVDTSVRPYTFKVIQGSDDMGTQIYDSRSHTWATKPSRQYGMSPGGAMVAYCKGVVFIRCELDEIVIYDTEEDKWDGINGPPDGDSDDWIRGVGAWDDRIFHPSVDPKQKVIRVWELADIAKQEWKEFDTMPGDLYSWLFYENSDPEVDYRDIQIRVSYCSEKLLIYGWYINDQDYFAKSDRFVLYNLASKAWEKLELPFAISEQPAQ